MFALAFSSLNRLCAHSERHVSFVLVRLFGAAYTLLMAITTINMCVPHANFSCSCVQTREILKNTRAQLQNTRVLPTRVFKV